MSKVNRQSSNSPGHIRRRTSKSGKVSWQAIVSYRVAGQRKVLSGTRETLQEAQSLLVSLLQEARTLSRTEIHEIETVTQLLDRFEDHRGQRWSASTRRQWESVRKRHYDPKWGTRKIREIGPLEVEDWLEDLAGGGGTATKPLTGATLRRILNPIASAFTYAVRKRLATSNPFESPELPVGSESTSEDVEESYPDPADAIRVLAALQVEPVVFAACQLAADTGMRRGEVCSLRFCDLDFNEGVLRIRRTAVLGPGDTVVVQSKTKTKTNRAIVLAASTLTMLREHRRRVMDEAARLGVAWSEELFIFSSPGEPQLPMRPDLLTSRWFRACESIGVAMRFHDLRHLHATMLLTSGFDLATVAGRLGHSGGGRMTLATYAHRIREIEAIAAEEMARKMRPKADDSEVEGKE